MQINRLKIRTQKEHNMNNVSHKLGWNSRTNPEHVEPLPIPLIKQTCNGNPDEDLVKLKMRRYPTSSTLDLYNSKMSLFDHGNMEDSLLFIHNFNMTLVVTGTLDMDANIQYLCTVFCGEALHQFDLFTADVENIETLNVDYYIKSLALYFSPVNSFSKKKCAMRRGMKKPRSIKVRRYVALFIDLNDCLDSSQGKLYLIKLM